MLAIYVIGRGREALPKGDSRTLLLSLHMSLGIGFMAALMLRVAWRLFVSPGEPVPMADSMRQAARLGHLGLHKLPPRSLDQHLVRG